MNRFQLLSALFLVLLGSPAKALDVVHLKSGHAIKGMVLSLGASSIRFKVIIEELRGKGESVRTISRKDIDFIDFHESEEETALLAQQSPDPKPLLSLLQKKERTLREPNSNAGEIALIYVRQLLANNEKSSANRALSWCAKVIDKDWDPLRRERAQHLRLQALVAVGKIEDAVEEATALLGKTEDPLAMIEARYVLASARAQKLLALVEKHPRWIDDDEIRPERNRLYHAAIDDFLYASLFQGSYAEPAARGLAGIITLYQNAGEHDHALAYATDLVSLYPNSPDADEAKRLIKAAPNL